MRLNHLTAPWQCGDAHGMIDFDHPVCRIAQVNWNDLRYVLAISRGGSLQAAGSTLGVAHTTVGRRLKVLEDQLGVRLFDRTPEGFVTTASGDDLAAVAEQVELQVLSAEGRMLGRDVQLRGELRVSTADVLFSSLQDIFTSFMTRHPSVELTVATSSESASLRRREADIALRLSNAPPEHLIGRKLGYMQFAVYAGQPLIDRLGDDAPLGSYPWIGWDGGPNHRWFNDWLKHHAPGARIVLRLSDRALLMAQAVRAGIGIQILPCVLADPDPKLQRLGELDELFRLDLWLLTLSELRTNIRVRTFMNHMGEAVAAHRDALAGE